MAGHVALPWIHRVFSLMKRWGLGTYHGLRDKHLDAYLNEFAFRYNRRFPIAMYPSRPCSALRPAAVLPPTGPSSVRPRSHPTEQRVRPQNLDQPESEGISLLHRT